MFAWTGHGVNTDREMKLSQFDLIRTPTGNGTKNQNKSKLKAHRLSAVFMYKPRLRESRIIFAHLCALEAKVNLFLSSSSSTFPEVLSIHPPTNLP